ncbi:MAG: tetratricopeptide repeat protein [candidate division Zixibacteria bacterium]|nr:tetratricopeptide repeat protein [candidate division Zixibacteria bacterium]
MRNPSRVPGLILVILAGGLFLLFCGGCKKKSDQARKHVEVGLEHFKKQEMQEALKEFKQAVQLDPINADAHFYLGGIYHAARAYDASIREYTEVLRINPRYRRIHTVIANIHYERGLRAWGKAVKLDRVTYWLPDTLRQLPFGRREELLGLVEDYEGKARADSGDAETFSRLSQAYFLLAAEEYEKAVKADPNDTTAQLYLGLTYAEQGYPYKAMAQYEITKKLDSNQGELLLAVLKQKEREKEGLEQIRKQK